MHVTDIVEQRMRQQRCEREQILGLAYMGKGPSVISDIFFKRTLYVRGGRGSDLCSYDVHRKKYRYSASSMPCTVATVHVLATHPVRLN